ncbi:MULTISPECIES: MarR family winged helix-turn-helix transcriptional regulator [unclassified Rhodococcus (in: high G+C Gram-positive bacteria)]|uniref:MarR family winged helix-turn-helix transcriptional regulator n=1 Tax=unclassified Rhodococcus (in: high G+C Gram-positive bacteria) TaxID=192944 RepID=UPI00146D33C4|nr:MULTISPECIES: MarR family transcriptional regulator [unclassified Rhodococcus (in: high G+C Gram-positive bacteria)]MBF0661757.1 MarR family transcriptional regulator [Rhodococcus sp. (in: high G+C Gram-positive bacteria)]NME80618.1 MarR family transcriptional regulator [Rhodococcus sp. 105337]
MPSSSDRPDYVDRVRRAWEDLYPDLDLRPLDVIGRITRIGALALTRLERELEPRGIGRTEFEVLSALARSPHPLRASEVTSVTGISGASTTKHTERLAKLGLVERLRLERDGRVVLLSLTDTGRALVESELPRRVQSERLMLDGLSEDELEVLTGLLRRIARNVEDQTFS